MFEWTFFMFYLGDTEVENPDLWTELVNEAVEDSIIISSEAFQEVETSDVFENIPGSISPSPATPSPMKKSRTGEY